jgi:hypothetical protein
VPNNKKKKMRKADLLVMVADDVDVRIDFTAGSPFTSNAVRINIPKNTAVAEFVGNRAGTFPYTIRCTNPVCITGNQPPEMIVL